MIGGNGLIEDLKNTWRRPGNVLVQLIIVNLSAFLLLSVIRVFLVLGGAAEAYESFLRMLTVSSVWGEIFARPWTVFTYAFLHEDFFHFLFNMLFFYWFGRILSDFLRPKNLLSLYLAGAVFSALFFVLMYNTVPYYQTRGTTHMLGASGSVYATVAAAATLVPNYAFHLLFVGPIKIKYIAIFYFFLSFAQLTGTNAGGQLAHLGGFAVGYLYITQLRKGRDLGKPFLWLLYSLANFFKKPKAKAPRRAREKEPKTEQEAIDRILEKISVSGYESLTKEERERLFNASKK